MNNIIVKSRHTMKKSLEKRFGDSCIIDLTSKAEDPWVKFSPFYPHGNISIPFSEQMGQSVEGIWQGLKVFETAEIDPSKFDRTDMKGLKRTVRRFGQCLGHQKGLNSKELLDYKTAREEIYIPMYKTVLETHLQDLVDKIRTIAKEQQVVLLDYEISTDWQDLNKPLSHANLVRLYLLNEYPNP